MAGKVGLFAAAVALAVKLSDPLETQLKAEVCMGLMKLAKARRPGRTKLLPKLFPKLFAHLS
jgi:hypothetical protein